MNIDPYILAFSAVTVLATIWMGFRSAGKSKTASDFFVAGRSVGVGMNASAISGEYLSAASFMGIAGMVMSSGYDALWYPVCYACGYLFLLLFIAGPLRRFGAYTIPDFAEGRFDSPVFRKIAVVFVLFIGFFYTMPQMKGAGTTLAYIFPGLPYWAGVVLVGAVITLNVALGGMKGITLVQAFQYWAKMFAISVPIFVLMAVYGHYGKQVGANGGNFEPRTSNSELGTNAAAPFKVQGSEFKVQSFEFQTFASALRDSMSWQERLGRARAKARGIFQQRPQGTNLPVAGMIRFQSTDGDRAIPAYEDLAGRTLLKANIPYPIARILYTNSARLTHAQAAQELEAAFAKEDWHFLHVDEHTTIVSPRARTNEIWQYVSTLGLSQREPLPAKAPADATWLNPFGPLTTKAAKTAAAAIGRKAAADSTMAIAWTEITPSRYMHEPLWARVTQKILPNQTIPPFASKTEPVWWWAANCAALTGDRYFISPELTNTTGVPFGHSTNLSGREYVAQVHAAFTNHGAITHALVNGRKLIVNDESVWETNRLTLLREPGVVRIITQPGPVGPGGAAAPVMALRAGLTPDTRLTVVLDSPTVAQALGVYAELTGRQLLPNTNSLAVRADELLGGKLSALKIIGRRAEPDPGVRIHADGPFTVAEVKQTIEAHLRTNRLALVAVGEKGFAVEPHVPSVSLSASAEKAWLAKNEKPLALLYTYSLIIAIVCGTAGLPHILVRFYTNPDGVAAKRTTMWVMILIGVFYVFPPVFGALGRNLLPDLYNGVGAKGTDKIVLELPRLLNEKYPPLGSILSGITCAGAFAAFMSTFSGLLVSMTGALAHDVYGRILKPTATPAQRMRMFKIGAVIIGGVAILLGMQVEQLQINFMVGQAFAIAAASYFPLLFMAVWWRNLTMKGAATGMLTGGLAALTCISLTSFSDLAAAPKASKFFTLFAGLNPFWAEHPLLRILAEQPAIWAVPMAIVLMIIVSKLTARSIPEDIRMKMLVLHAPEQLGLKQEYIQEHQHGH